MGRESNRSLHDNNDDDDDVEKVVVSAGKVYSTGRLSFSLTRSLHRECVLYA